MLISCRYLAIINKVISKIVANCLQSLHYLNLYVLAVSKWSYANQFWDISVALIYIFNFCFWGECRILCQCQIKCSVSWGPKFWWSRWKIFEIRMFIFLQMASMKSPFQIDVHWICHGCIANHTFSIMLHGKLLSLFLFWITFHSKGRKVDLFEQTTTLDLAEVCYQIGINVGSPPWLDYRRKFRILPLLERLKWPYIAVFNQF